jgi:primosomal protein N' (replication factor Y)
VHYFEVLVTSNKYHGSEALTYSHPEEIQPGTIVNVPLRNQKTTAIVLKNTTKPSYKLKPVTEIFEDLVLPRQKLKLISWIASYYPSNISSVASLFLPKQLSARTAKPATTSPDEQPKTQQQPANNVGLTKEQSSVINSIVSDAEHSSFLIHGETGTGKTRVYIELAIKQLDEGRDCLILTPEISLTPQLLAEFKSNISSPIFVIHSNLTEAQKRTIWLKIIRSKQPLVVIGARSALFSPIKNLGLIVIDECHDSSYKQDQFPKYNALFVAGQLAKLHNAKLVLGSATPNIADYYLFQSKQLPILRMQAKATGIQHKPEIKIIDIRDKDQFPSHRQLSSTLISDIKKALRSNQQSLIFLNKRGSARLINCDSCGWIELCPNCQIPLTFHHDKHQLRCHTCGYTKQAVISCSNCGSSQISYRVLGTKSLFDQLQASFPGVNIKRFDTDSSKTEKLENNFPEVKAGKVQIIVGTQILAKGLDLPKLGLVGIISADSNLSFPDYRSEENNYQLIKQIIGRVSRGHSKGTVVIQTLNPTSASLLAATSDSWHEFYNSQLQQRSDFHLPPFCYVLKIIIQRKTEKTIQQTSKQIITAINNLNLGVEINGPAPRFNEHAMGSLNWQIIVKSTNRSNLLTIISGLPKNVNYDLDPINLL